MPVNIMDVDAINVMALVEGDHWKQYQLEHPECISGFLRFKQAYEEMIKKLSPDELKYRREIGYGVGIEGNSAIYGDGGFHRYFVRSDGNIVFSKSHSFGERITKARDAGFTISGEER